MSKGGFIGLMIGLVVEALLAVGLTAKAEHDSCVRQHAPRQAQFNNQHYLEDFMRSAAAARAHAAEFDVRASQRKLDHQASLAYLHDAASLKSPLPPNCGSALFPSAH